MNLYSITNRTSGLHLGTYLGMDVADAIDAMACDAGYDSQAHAAAALGTTVEALFADLVIAEVDLAATVKEIAEAMVSMDRESGDVEPEVLDDPAAGDPSHWDATPLRAYIADATHVDRALVAAIAKTHMHLVHHAYGRAWRAAVELELSSRDEVAS